MDRPKLYINENTLQHEIALEFLTKNLLELKWKLNENVLDIGCGPGDVTVKKLLPLIQDKINKLIAVDKCSEMVEFANDCYNVPEVEFQIMDIQDSSTCLFYTEYFNKIFSFMCLHWAVDQQKVMNNIYSMLKSDGEILITFLKYNPFFKIYESLDMEFQKYVKNIMPKPVPTLSSEELKAHIENTGFKIIKFEEITKLFTHKNTSDFLSAMKAVDNMYHILPKNLHEKYTSIIQKTMIKGWNFIEYSTVGKLTLKYTIIAIHAIKY
ncbi:juvenile hormone acid O-methyltransferase-like [Daktulosphaira vitifoliae]|uniref:juvenile hormone acid O-methyltransferase-like n=1 Tax=Daktulosphaira vitifoliae TaxID=58002 RepID=UPI0021A98752|nr:juvenile hormone acid O-methyltransferase-like [Daktulosphaira vitifoliae]